jgi:hypothetical protein
MGAGNTPNNGGGGCYAGPGSNCVVFNPSGRQIMGSQGGGGGGRNIGGNSGCGSVDGGGTLNCGYAGNWCGAQCPGHSTDSDQIGRGGEGGGLYSGGRSGYPAEAHFQYTVNIEGASWNTLISGINNQYKSSYNRPADKNEMEYWIGEYRNYNYDTVSEIQSTISTLGEARSSTGAIDECGAAV